MENTQIRYAKLLLDYCLEIKPGDKLYIVTSMLAEPLVREVYRYATQLGAQTEIDFQFSGKSKMFFDNAPDELLTSEPVFHKKALEEFDAYLNIRAPYNLNETSNIDPEKRKKRSEAIQEINNIYFERTADRHAPGALRRCLCQYPTEASAQKANMSLEEYSAFVYQACHLNAENPKAEWLKIREDQQRIKEYLDKVKEMQYKSDKTDIRFSVEGRTWINSDGQANMPSGEVFSAPVEDSVNGKVYFSFPSIYMGRDVSGISLWVENGKIIKWDAEEGGEVLDQVFSIAGANYFGEVAIGTNYNIRQSTRNILFDEKIGGTIHMAVGQSYKQCGGLNRSSIHWDMITDMTESGQIYADGKLIYEKGKFLI